MSQPGLTNRMANRTQATAKGLYTKAQNASTSHKVFGGILLIIVLLIVIYFIYKIYKDFMKHRNDSPWIIEGTRQGNNSLQLPAYELPVANDGQYGTEFTYSMWLYVKDDNFTLFNSSVSGKCASSHAFKHIFHKGSSDYYNSKKGIKYPLLQGPGLWLYPNENKLAINMNTYASVKETCDIGNIPLNKWFHLTIMLVGNSLDVYINCNLKKRCRLRGVPKINFGNLYITNYGGFDGLISRFRYYNYAIFPYQVEQACSLGPSNAPCTDPGEKPPYLANNYWMTTGYPRTLLPMGNNHT